jgi:hypothetical protein
VGGCIKGQTWLQDTQGRMWGPAAERFRQKTCDNWCLAWWCMRVLLPTEDCDCMGLRLLPMQWQALQASDKHHRKHMHDSPPAAVGTREEDG